MKPSILKKLDKGILGNLLCLLWIHFGVDLIKEQQHVYLKYLEYLFPTKFLQNPSYCLEVEV